jgi:hypothetical protein
LSIYISSLAIQKFFNLEKSSALLLGFFYSIALLYFDIAWIGLFTMK